MARLLLRSIATLGCLAAALAASANAATVELAPAAGSAAATVSLRGSGFPARAQALVRLGAHRRVAVRTTARGALRATLTVPGGRRPTRIVTRSGSRRVANLFRA